MKKQANRNLKPLNLAKRINTRKIQLIKKVGDKLQEDTIKETRKR